MHTALMSAYTEATRRYIGERIREARGSLSHDAFGKTCGMGRQHLISLEQGKHLPREATLVKLAKASGHPVEWFLPDHARAA